MGKIHVIVELKWHGKLKSTSFFVYFLKNLNRKIHVKIFVFSLTDQSNTQGAVSTSTKSTGGPEFKERAAFNRRRGAMRRRVHQV